MWNVTFKRCEICPSSTYSRSGDTSCTCCPTLFYSIEQIPVCFPIGRIGGIMKLDQNYAS